MRTLVSHICGGLRVSARRSLLVAAAALVALWAVEAEAAGRLGARKGEGGYIDAHAHLHGSFRSHGETYRDYEAATRNALAIMDQLSIVKTLIMPPPAGAGGRGGGDYRELASVAREHPERFAFLGGGRTLNPIIQSVKPTEVTPEIRRGFEEKAAEILRAGAKGFGELSALHLSFNPRHRFHASPPDHPLFLLLADIAARRGVPIDLHMEAVARDMDTPARMKRRSFLNPPALGENMRAFERLLAHNRGARIIWSHAGWDNTGRRTVARMRRLLETHPNLYMSVKVQPLKMGAGSPLGEGGKVRPEWLELVSDFPGRFIIGSDNHYVIPGAAPPPLAGVYSRRRQAMNPRPRRFLSQLPPPLARRVGYENAVAIFNLK